LLVARTLDRHYDWEGPFGLFLGMSVDTLGVQSLYRSGRHTISKNFGRFGVAGFCG
jgi:hypothetical protein